MLLCKFSNIYNSWKRSNLEKLTCKTGLATLLTAKTRISVSDDLLANSLINSLNMAVKELGTLGGEASLFDRLKFIYSYKYLINCLLLKHIKYIPYLSK